MKRITTLTAAAFVATAGMASADAFNGFYIGGQFGGSDIGTNIGVTGSGESFGVYAGYNFGVGSSGVLGVEVDADSTNYTLSGGAGTVDSTYRLKLRGGGIVGRGLLYGTAGWVQANTSALSDGSGYFYGIGYDYPVSNNVTIGAEWLRHELDGFSVPTLDVTVDTFKFRVAYNF